MYAHGMPCTFRSVARLMEVSNDQQLDPFRPKAEECEDSLLADELLTQTQRLIADRPELVLHAAAALGWTVIPPAEDELREMRPAATQEPEDDDASDWD